MLDRGTRVDGRIAARRVRMASAVALIVRRLHRRRVGHAAAVILFRDG